MDLFITLANNEIWDITQEQQYLFRIEAVFGKADIALHPLVMPM